MDATKKFFAEVFGWEFEDAGPDYMAFLNQGLDGGRRFHFTDPNGNELAVWSESNA